MLKQQQWSHNRLTKTSIIENKLVKEFNKKGLQVTAFSAKFQTNKLYKQILHNWKIKGPSGNTSYIISQKENKTQNLKKTAWKSRKISEKLKLADQ